ncbi:hypothetical protein ACFQ60_08995 [Streptomyces zhihengii]
MAADQARALPRRAAELRQPVLHQRGLLAIAELARLLDGRVLGGTCSTTITEPIPGSAAAASSWARSS